MTKSKTLELSGKNQQRYDPGVRPVFPTTAGRVTDRALLIADIPGHIVERIGKHWADYGVGVRHEVLTTEQGRKVNRYLLLRRAEETGIVFWLDVWRFMKSSNSLRRPQLAMIHHIDSDGEAEVRKSLPDVDIIATASVHWQRRLQEMSGREITLIPYTVDTEKFRPSDKTRDRRAAGIGDDEFVIGFLANKTANQQGRKDPDLFLKVVEAASEKWKDIRLVLVGIGWEEMVKKIEGRGIRVFYRTYESTEDTVEAYHLMDCLLCTSFEEGGPVTVLEAMACEVPVITSVVGHVPEVVTDGERGFLCPGRKVEEYLEAIQALRNNQGLAAAMKRQGLEFILKNRSSQKVIPSIDFPSLYRQALSNYRMRPFGDYLSRTLNMYKYYQRYQKKIRRGEIEKGTEAFRCYSP